MKYFLIKQDVNYADEFDVNGFFTLKAQNEEEVEKYCLESLTDEHGNEFPLEIYFGTNEAIEFQDEEDYLLSLDILEITKAEYDLLDKLFDGQFGQVF